MREGAVVVQWDFDIIKCVRGTDCKCYFRIIGSRSRAVVHLQNLGDGRGGDEGDEEEGDGGRKEDEFHFLWTFLEEVNRIDWMGLERVEE